jgi:fructose-1,6-bisphosphatase/inositol monophosphatase family enzyme
MEVADPAPIQEMDAIIGTNFLPEPRRTIVQCNLSRLGIIPGCGAPCMSKGMAASAHCHLLFYNRLTPWDHAAGWLLHREAGGHSAHFDGTSYAPTHLAGELICAPAQASWQLARHALLERAN